MKQKEKRQSSVKDRLEKQLASGTKMTKEGEVPLEDKDKTRIKKELEIVKARLSGEKKKRATKVEGQSKDSKGDKWFIDIFTVSFSRVKHSERRKAKGKSRKKTRTVKTVSFFKSVTVQPGLIQAYREGRMGISPKSHSFRMRKEEVSNL